MPPEETPPSSASPPLSDVLPITEDDMFVEWGKAELPEAHRQREAPKKAPPELRQKLARGDALTPEERRTVAGLMRENRREILSLPLPAIEWFTAVLATSRVGALELDGYWVSMALGAGRPPCVPWREPHPRTVHELSAHPDAPPLTTVGDFAPASLCGLPILLGESLDGPWCVADGTNRLRSLWRSRVAGRETPETLAVVVGVHPSARSWKRRDAWLALHRTGWQYFGVYRVKNVAEDRRFAVLCPNTRRAVIVAEQTFTELAALGIPELPTVRADEWTWSSE